MKREEIIFYWIEKAEQDIASARDNYAAGRLLNTVRDAYFASFHAFSSVLLKENKSFKKHKEVRSALHRDYIRTNKIKDEWGKIMTGFLITGRRLIIVHLFNSNQNR